VVSGVGTGGTITGVGEALKSRNPNIKIVAVEPDASPVLSGGQPGPHKLQGLGAGFVPAVLNTKIYDEVIRVKEADSAPISKQINQQDGIPVGISSGAAIWAALQLAKRPETLASRSSSSFPQAANAIFQRGCSPTSAPRAIRSTICCRKCSSADAPPSRIQANCRKRARSRFRDRTRIVGSELARDSQPPTKSPQRMAAGLKVIRIPGIRFSRQDRP